MKRISAFFSLLLLLALTAPAQTSSPAQPEPKAAGTYYVIAPNGLNLREAAQADSKKLETLPYGTRVELTESATALSMTVDHLSGGMAKVSHGEAVGYVFDGYLSRYPSPELNQETADYVEQIRRTGQEVYHESIERDWGGYFQQEEAIVLYGEAWEEAFLVAKQLYRLPEKLLFPTASKEIEQTFPNPDKEDYSWTDEMVVTRKPDGNLLTISYTLRSEGGGRQVVIEHDESISGLRVSEVQIAD